MNPSVDAAEVVAALRDATLGQIPEAVELALGDPEAMRIAVEGVLSPIQREVGRRWERGAITADEALAVTAVVDASITQLWGAAEGFVVPRGPRVGIACAPGEWHEVPARMAAIELRCEGCNVTLLGASVTTEQLEAFAREVEPHAVALSASLTSRFAAVADSVAALHRRGVPVIVGGAAFGADATRARALGADAWCADGDTAGQTVRAWERHAPHIDPDPAARAVVDPAERAAVIDTALRTRLRVEQEWAASRSDGDNHRAGVELDALLNYTEAAVLAGDDTVLTEALGWWDRHLALEGAEANVRTTSVDALVQALPRGRRRALLLRTRAALPPSHPDGDAPNGPATG
ncbi:MAG TPA: cobalamin B12-binding domain-containing protein [Acidimicrobiia bacterium]